MGLFGSRASSEPWRKLLVGHDAHVSQHSPPGSGVVSVIFVTPKADILAATQGGVLRSRDRGRTWRFVGLSQTVHSFVSTANGGLLAGTENGIFRSADDGETWIERSIGLTAFRIYCLAVAPDEPFTPAHELARCFVLPTAGTAGVQWGGAESGARPCGLEKWRRARWCPWGSVPWSRGSQSWQPIPLPTQLRTSVVRALMQDKQGFILAVPKVTEYSPFRRRCHLARSE